LERVSALKFAFVLALLSVSLGSQQTRVFFCWYLSVGIDSDSQRSRSDYAFNRFWGLSSGFQSIDAGRTDF
jgi:hypothetical protein